MTPKPSELPAPPDHWKQEHVHWWQQLDADHRWIEAQERKYGLDDDDTTDPQSFK